MFGLVCFVFPADVLLPLYQSSPSSSFVIKNNNVMIMMDDDDDDELQGPCLFDLCTPVPRITRTLSTYVLNG